MANQGGDKRLSRITENERSTIGNSGNRSQFDYNQLYYGGVDHNRQYYSHDQGHQNIQYLLDVLSHRGGAFGASEASHLYRQQTQQSPGEGNLDAYIGHDNAHSGFYYTEQRDKTIQTFSPTDTYSTNLEGQNQDFPDISTISQATSIREDSRFLIAHNDQFAVSYEKVTGKPRAAWDSEKNYIPLFTMNGFPMDTYNSEDKSLNDRLTSSYTGYYNEETQSTFIFDTQNTLVFYDSRPHSTTSAVTPFLETAFSSYSDSPKNQQDDTANTPDTVDRSKNKEIPNETTTPEVEINNKISIIKKFFNKAYLIKVRNAARDSGAAESSRLREICNQLMTFRGDPMPIQTRTRFMIQYDEVDSNRKAADLLDEYKDKLNSMTLRKGTLFDAYIDIIREYTRKNLTN